MGIHRDIVANDRGGYRRENGRRWNERCYESDRRHIESRALKHTCRRRRKNETINIINEELNEPR